MMHCDIDCMHHYRYVSTDKDNVCLRISIVSESVYLLSNDYFDDTLVRPTAGKLAVWKDCNTNVHWLDARLLLCSP